MAFDLDTWKAHMLTQLRGWRKRMQKSKIESVYAFLAAATLWPVAQAARQGDWSALTALDAVVSGVDPADLGNLGGSHLVRLPSG